MMTHVIPDVHSDPTDSDDDDAITQHNMDILKQVFDPFLLV